MASIQIRKRDKGTIYRLRIRKAQQPNFELFFDSIKKANDWLEENEEAFLIDCTRYFKWVKANRESIQMNGIFHVHIPLYKF